MQAQIHAPRTGYAYNLLDNPDFAIAQAGYNGYHGAIKYVCDRWTTGNANVNLTGKTLTYSASISEGVPTSVIMLVQKIADSKRLQGKNVTFAIKASGISVSSGEQFYMADSLFSVAGTGENVAIQNGVNVYNFTAAESLTTDAAVIVWLPVNSTDQITASITIDEIALYDGEYTADTLPPYQPKGYAVELAECQRYYQVLPETSSCIFSISPQSGRYFSNSFALNPMRASPNVTFVTDDNGNIGIVQGVSLVSASEINIVYNDRVKNGILLLSTTNAAYAGLVMSFNGIQFSADL